MQLLQFLRTELAPKPGRLEDALRIVIFTILVVVLTETFQTPLPAYSAYIVFFISKEERVSTFLTGIIAALSITVAVFLALAIYMISAGEPGLRLPLMAFIVLIGMFFSRTFSLGLAAFAVGFLVTISLTLIDFLPRTLSIPIAQELTKSVLWLWAIIMLPVSIVIFGNIVSGRDPNDLFYQGLKDRLEVAGRLLIDPYHNPNDQKKIVAYAQEGTDELLKHLKMAGIFKTIALKKDTPDSKVVAHVGRLMILLVEWTAVKPSGLTPAASECGALLLSIAQSLKTKNPVFQKLTISPYVAGPDSERKDDLLLATIIEITEALSRILEEPPVQAKKYIEKPIQKLLVPDAFSNPEYVRYALKTTLAIFITYITYNMLNWPEIRTCLITCFFVALSTVGETVHKMILRLMGAIVGGILGLGTVIFIMPHLTTITGLSLVIAVITFCAAWVALSSARLSYAGLQIALAFFLCTLIGYSPHIELTPARDRVIGVIFGNLIIFVIFTLIWPTRAVVKTKHFLSEALDKLSQIFVIDSVALGQEQGDQDTLFFAFNTALSRARNFANLDPLELLNERSRTEKVDIYPNNLNSNSSGCLGISWVEAVQALSGPAILLVEHPCSLLKSALSKTDQSKLLQSVSTYLFHLVELIKGNKPVDLQLPKIDSLIHDLEITSTDSNAHVWLLACADWYCTLNKRLFELAILLKQATQDQLQLNPDIRESSETS